MRPLALWTINGERFAGKTAGETPKTVKWLAGLSQDGAPIPDVLCLQDFRVSMIRYLKPFPYFSFVSMTNHMFWGEREPLGICIASRWPLDQIDVHHTWGDGIVRDLEGVGDDQERIKPDELADRLILKTQNRVAIACNVMRPGDKEPIRIATHHGFWVRQGVPTPQQMQSTASICVFLAHQASKHGGLVYAADYNPDKEGRVLRMYRESGGRDCVPAEIRTTLTEYHPAARFGIRSDCVMTWPDRDGRYPYLVENVRLDSSPGSDHYMICSEVTRAAK